MTRLIAVAAFVLLGACGDGGTDPLPPADGLTGKWAGARVGDWQNVTLNIVEHSPSEIRGTWTGNIGGPTRSGLILSGSRDGNRFSLTLDTGGMPCGYGTHVEAERNGTVATGTAWTLHCDGSRSGWTSPVRIVR